MTKEIGFEERLLAFENIVRKLKTENLSLEESLKLVDEGRKHYNICNELLENTAKELEIYAKN